MNKNWIYACLLLIASIQPLSLMAVDDDNMEGVPLLDYRSWGYKYPLIDPSHYNPKTRMSMAIALSLLITASTNFAFPKETIGYFTNQLSAELIAAAARDHHIFKKLLGGGLASMLAASIDWYYVFPAYKRNLGLGVAGTQTCIMFIRDWLLEEGLGMRLPRIRLRD